MATAKNPTRSMTSYKGFCQKKAKKIDDFLHANPDLNSEDIQKLKKLNTDLESQLERMQTAWEAMMDEVEPDVHTALDKMLSEMSEEVERTLAVSEKAISDKAASTQSGTGTTSSAGNTKIDDTLKPRQ